MCLKVIVACFSVPIGVPGGKSGCMFTPVNVEVTCYEPEVVGGMLDMQLNRLNNSW
jgi:translation initiation factor 3 subunit F